MHVHLVQPVGAHHDKRVAQGTKLGPEPLDRVVGGPLEQELHLVVERHRLVSRHTAGRGGPCPDDGAYGGRARHDLLEGLQQDAPPPAAGVDHPGLAQGRQQVRGAGQGLPRGPGRGGDDVREVGPAAADRLGSLAGHREDSPLHRDANRVVGAGRGGQQRARELGTGAAT